MKTCPSVALRQTGLLQVTHGYDAADDGISRISPVTDDGTVVHP